MSWQLFIQQKYNKLNELSTIKLKVSIYEAILVIGCIFAILLIYFRAFFGTEITDEAYYISNALTILHGNLPFAYNNDALTFGAYFILIPQIYIYELFIPSLEGIFLFSRISFVTFRILILLFSYRIIRKTTSRKNALLAIAILIPYSGGVIPNYSYNSVPTLILFLAALLLYDAIENSEKNNLLKITLAGFLSSFSFFSHIAYAVAIIIFLGIIIIRSNKDNRLKFFLAYSIGGLLEVFIVFLPIMIQAGLNTLFEGLILYIKPFPSQPMSSNTWVQRLWALEIFAKPYVQIALFFILVSYFFIRRYVAEENEKYTSRESLSAAMLISLLVCIMTMIQDVSYDSQIDYLGLLSAIHIFLFFLTRLSRGKVLPYYMSIYPVIFAVVLACSTGTNAVISRFYSIIPALIGILIVLLESRRELIRVLASITAIICIFIIGYSQCKYVYRDAALSSLKYKVNEGVYRGIYTTEQRAKDLPEIENYLNSAIKENEYVSFRDNVPFAYLMNRKGKMCDLNTWDSMQYSYGCNAPAKLFAYYKRVGHIPDKIIYIDFGRDEHLSIENDGFRYNDFVNEYYILTEDITLNNTFYHLMVYQYNGLFNGDYDYWIDTYYDLPKQIVVN